MIELFKDKRTDLEFKLDIQGNSFVPEARLSISITENISFTIKGIVENNQVKVSIPPLKDFLKDTTFSSVNLILEVIADQNYFIPWKGQATVDDSITVGVVDFQYESTEAKKAIKVESSIISKNASKIKFI
jgi:hypothetical protein